MVTAITGFMGLFKDFGLSMATVQREKITHEEVSMLFWVNIALSIGLALLVAISAPLIAAFYGDNRLMAITLLFSLGFILSGVSIQHQAIIRRQMRFRTLAGIEVLSMSVGVAATVVAAMRGLGYWALAILPLVTAFVGSLSSFVACPWRPGFPKRVAGTRSLIQFGGNLTLFSILNYVSRNADNILLGRFWGAGPLGFYTRAYNILLVPLWQLNAPLTQVAIPGLSRLQRDPDQFKKYFLRAAGVISYLSIPLVTLLAVLSDEIVLVLLGEQWREVGTLFRLLSIAALVQPITNITGWVFISLGRTDRMVKWSYITVPLCILAFLIGLPWGPRGVACSFSILNLLLVYPLLRVTFKDTSIRPAEVLERCWRPLVLSLSTLPAVFLMKWGLHNQPAFLRGMASAATGVAVFGIVAILWPAVHRDYYEIKSLFQTANR
jgi:PST family polysaccharide transporter